MERYSHAARVSNGHLIYRRGQPQGHHPADQRLRSAIDPAADNQYASFDIPTGLDLGNPKQPRPFLFDSNNLATFAVNVSASKLADPGLAGPARSVHQRRDGFSQPRWDHAEFERHRHDLALQPRVVAERVRRQALLQLASAPTARRGVSLPISLSPTDDTGTLKPPLTITVKSLADLLDGDPWLGPRRSLPPRLLASTS